MNAPHDRSPAGAHKQDDPAPVCAPLSAAAGIVQPVAMDDDPCRATRAGLSGPVPRWETFKADYARMLAAAPCAPTSDETKLHSAAERALRALQAFPGFRAGDSPHAQRFNEMLVGAIHELRAALASSCAPTSAGTDEREAFEAWAKKHDTADHGWWLRQIDDGGYSCQRADDAWAAWKARALASPAGTVQPTSAAPAGVQADIYWKGFEDGKAHAAQVAATPPTPAGVQPVAWQWRRKGELWTLEKTFNSEVFATTPDSEVRRLYATPPTPASEAVVQDAARVSSHEQEAIWRENAAFDAWWVSSGHAADPTFTLTTENCARATWHARAALASPVGTAQQTSAAPERPLPPLPPIDAKDSLPYSAIRYVNGYPAEYVQRYATAYARAALSSPVAAQPVRVPLTEEQIASEFRRMQDDEESPGTFDFYDFRSGVRFGEAAHCIVPLAPQDTGGK